MFIVTLCWCCYCSMRRLVRLFRSYYMYMYSILFRRRHHHVLTLEATFLFLVQVILTYMYMYWQYPIKCCRSPLPHTQTWYLLWVTKPCTDLSQTFDHAIVLMQSLKDLNHPDVPTGAWFRNDLVNHYKTYVMRIHLPFAHWVSRNWTRFFCL